MIAGPDIQPILSDLALDFPSPEKAPEKETVSYDRIKRPKNHGSDTISFPDNLYSRYQAPA